MTGLSVTGLNMTTADMTPYTGLEYLNVSYSDILTGINLTGLENLQVLYVDNNGLTSLDVSTLTRLVILHCSYNPLRSLDLSHNSMLAGLECNYTELTAIDLGDNSPLSSWVEVANIAGGHNYSSNTNLYENGRSVFIQEENDVYFLSTADFLEQMGPDFDMAKVVANSWSEGIDFSETGKVKFTSTDGNDYGTITYRYQTDYVANHQDNVPGVATVEFHIDWEQALPIDEVHFPDEVFRRFIHLRYDKNNDWYLARKERTSNTIYISSWDVDRMGGFTTNDTIRSIEGIQYMGELEYFDLNIYDDGDDYECFGANIPTADFSRNPNMRNISMSNSGMQTINVSGLQKLEYLSLGQNKLTAINVSDNPILRSLSLDENKLTSLNVSTAPKLQYLRVNENELTALDLSNNPMLEDLECNMNKLTALDLSQNTMLRYLECAYNEITALDVSAAPRLREILACHNQIATLKLPQAYYPGGTITTEWGEETKEAGYYLGYINFAFNKLASLDLSDYKGLRGDPFIAVNDNLLTSLILPTMANVSDGAPRPSSGRSLKDDSPSSPSGIEGLLAQNNKLTEISLAGQENLQILDVSGNPLKAINLSDLESLMAINIYNTEIVALDLSDNPGLIHLQLTKMSEEDRQKFPQYADDFDEEVEWINMLFGQIGNIEGGVEGGIISPNGPTIMADKSKLGDGELLFFWLDDTKETSLTNRLGAYGFKADDLAGGITGGYILEPDQTIPADAPDYVKSIKTDKLQGKILVIDPNSTYVGYNTPTGYQAASFGAPRRSTFADVRLKGRGNISLKEDSDPVRDSLQEVYEQYEFDPALRNARFQNAQIQLNWTDPGVITAIESIYVDPRKAAGAQVVSVRYVNVAGISSDRPFEGVNIVVTTYSDGSTTTTKVRY